LEENATVSRKWATSSAVIATIHGTSFFGHSTVLEDLIILILAHQLQPNNNIFQVQTLKALNTAVFCHTEMYQHSEERAASITPDLTLWLHYFYQTARCYILENSSAHHHSCDHLKSCTWKTQIKQYDKTVTVLTWKKIDTEDIIIHL
jgi:hypothetical protein